jgi:hypothetical protein
MGLVACILAFAVTLAAARRGLVWGILALLATGYLYGIVRANIADRFAHFIFDASLIGLFLVQLFHRLPPAEARRAEAMKTWVIILIGWPMLVVLLPFQTLLVSLVGLRGNAFFLPVLLLAARLGPRELRTLSIGLAGLNILALSFGVAEYLFSVQRFYPFNSLTLIIYASNDVGEGLLRIPAIFINAHAYAGTMVGTLPVLFGGWTQKDTTKKSRFLCMCGMLAALVGVVLASTRLNFALAGLVVGVGVLSAGNLDMRKRVTLIALACMVSIWALTNARFQRFKTLADGDLVSERIAGSVNRNFFEILVEYPMGNGLGGGGTSIPYFLANEVRKPVAMENEYSRILLEQGLIGLILWVGFFAWVVTRPYARIADSWQVSRRMAWVATASSFTVAAIGTGMLTAIPPTMLLFINIAIISVPPAAEPVSASALPFGRAGRVESRAVLAR